MELDLNKGNALIVVAHPDDETIWMGGIILSNPEVKWTIFSLSRGSDSDRRPRYESSARIYGGKALMADFEDNGIMKLRASIAPIENEILSRLKKLNFDFIFTHGSGGEYGHSRHKGVHFAVKNLIRKNKLSANKIFVFAYHMDERLKFAKPDLQSDFTVELPENIFLKKKFLINKIYGFGERSFESLSAGRVEKFNILKK